MYFCLRIQLEPLQNLLFSLGKGNWHRLHCNGYEPMQE